MGKEMVTYTQVEGGSNTNGEYNRPAVFCNFCGKENLDTYIDGATNQGFWAEMCPKCYRKYGQGLGIGKGQKYIAK